MLERDNRPMHNNVLQDEGVRSALEGVIIAAGGSNEGNDES